MPQHCSVPRCMRSGYKDPFGNEISLFSAMGPVAYLGNVRAPARLLAPFADIIANLWKSAGKGQFLVSSPALQKIATNLCGRKFGDEICTAILFLAAGVDSHQTNRSRLNVYFSHDPAGTSVNDFLQFAQLIKCDCFRKFDYGIIKNIAKYGKSRPPGYVLSRVEVPVAIYWSKGDWFAAEKDVARLRKELSNVVEYFQVPEEQFTHLDFAWGINAEPILYRKMMSVMAKYET